MKIKSTVLAALMAALPVSAADLTPNEVRQIASEAYIYLYPIITMDVSRLQMTNIEAGKIIGRGPMNMFHHMREYPGAEFRAVVRPNFDTLYSSAWLDLSKEPVLISMPATAGRYYLLPVLDMYTDVLGAPGSRTSGTGEQLIAVVPPGWKGKLPAGAMRLQATTPYTWLIGRIQTNGVKDYAAVNAIQDKMSVTLLSNYGKPPVTPVVKIDPNVDMKTPPLEQVNGMAPEKYFAYGSRLMKAHRPHVTDWSQLARFRRIGLRPDGKFDAAALPPELRPALAQGAADGLKSIKELIPTVGRMANGWSLNTSSMGVYGNYYLKRAVVAMVGLGANQPEDAVYPLAVTDKDGQPFTGEQRYVLHFKAGELPPNDAFWSLTMYDADGFQVANELNRFAISSHDALQFNSDGSLDIYIQHVNPGPAKVSNWLPSPASGLLGLTMRIYAPRASVLDMRWVPPAIEKQ